MVGVINANESSPQSFEAFRAKAVATNSPTSTSYLSGSVSGTPTGTTSATQSTQSKGAAPARFVFQAGSGVGMALAGVALGLIL